MTFPLCNEESLFLARPAEFARNVDDPEVDVFVSGQSQRATAGLSTPLRFGWTQANSPRTYGARGRFCLGTQDCASLVLGYYPAAPPGRPLLRTVQPSLNLHRES